MIRVSGLKKHYRVHKRPPGMKAALKSLFKRDYQWVKAVDGIDFSLEAGERVGFEKVCVHPRAGVAAVGDAHQELLQRRDVGGGDTAHVVVPLQNRPGLGELPRPLWPGLSIAARKKLVRGRIVHGFRSGRYS